MRPFSRDTKSGKGRGDKKFGGRSQSSRSFGERDSSRTEMFSATCSECGNACEVPFKPTGRKPILCGNCFRKDAPSDQKRFRGTSSDRPRFDSRRTPYGDRGESSTYRGRGSDSQSDELKKINAKLDAILRLLS
ncbi:hypothetical protein HY732_00125 [Candidatus Uhrbacteria bacterium]|nr:hypothetical protein [Candidatus Uhrbacteria bacterium]